MKTVLAEKGLEALFPSKFEKLNPFSAILNTQQYLDWWLSLSLQLSHWSLRHFSRGLWLLFLVLYSQTAQKRLLRRLGLSLRGRGRGFAPATIYVAPGYFHRETEEKYNQKKFLTVWFPSYLLYLPGNLKSKWHSCTDLLKYCWSLTFLLAFKGYEQN